MPAFVMVVGYFWLVEHGHLTAALLTAAWVGVGILHAAWRK